MGKAERDEPSAKTAKTAYWTLAVLTLINIVNYADRNVLTILSESIKHDLNISDAKLGFLYGTTFAVFFAVFGMPLGRLADSWRRGWLLAIGLTTWSAMTTASAFANSFGQLAIARLGVGLGETAATPCAQSLITDLFPRFRRALPISIYVSGVSLGGGLALFLGGQVAQHWNTVCGGFGLCHLRGWQAAFLMAGMPGLVLAIFAARLKEPVRGALDGLVCKRRSASLGAFGMELSAVLPPLTLLHFYRLGGWQAAGRNVMIGGALAALAAGMSVLTGDPVQFGALALGLYALSSSFQSIAIRDRPFFRLTLGSRSYVFGLGGTIAVNCISGTVAFWAVPYAIRTFHLQPGLTGMLFGSVLAVTSFSGLIGGGALADWWRRRDLRAPFWLAGISLLLNIPVVFIMFTTHSFPLFVAGYAVFALTGQAWTGATAALAQELVLPRMRGSSSSAFSLWTLLIHLAVGPYAAGKVSEVTGSLSTGVLSIYVLAPFGLVGLWLGARWLAQDEATLTERAVAAGEPTPR